MKFVKGALLSSHSPLEPHLPQEQVQCQDPHHKTRIEREPGSEGLHVGSGVSLTIVQLSRC